MSSFAVKSPLVEQIVKREVGIIGLQNDFNRHLSNHERSTLLHKERFNRRRKWWTKSVTELTRRLEVLSTIVSTEDTLTFAD